MSILLVSKKTSVLIQSKIRVHTVTLLITMRSAIMLLSFYLNKTIRIVIITECKQILRYTTVEVQCLRSSDVLYQFFKVSIKLLSFFYIEVTKQNSHSLIVEIIT